MFVFGFSYYHLKFHSSGYNNSHIVYLFPFQFPTHMAVISIFVGLCLFLKKSLCFIYSLKWRILRGNKSQYYLLSPTWRQYILSIYLDFSIALSSATMFSLLEILSSFCFQESILFQFRFFSDSSFSVILKGSSFFSTYALNIMFPPGSVWDPLFFILYILSSYHYTFPYFKYHFLTDDSQIYIFSSLFWMSLHFHLILLQGYFTYEYTSICTFPKPGSCPFLPFLVLYDPLS